MARATTTRSLRYTHTHTLHTPTYTLYAYMHTHLVVLYCIPLFSRCAAHSWFLASHGMVFVAWLGGAGRTGHGIGGECVGEKERGAGEGFGTGEINDNVRHWDEATSKRGVMIQEGKGEVGGEETYATTMPPRCPMHLAWGGGSEIPVFAASMRLGRWD